MIISLSETCASVWLQTIYRVSLPASTFIKDDISYWGGKMDLQTKVKMQSFESVRDNSDYIRWVHAKKWMNVEQNIKELELRRVGNMLLNI